MFRLPEPERRPVPPLEPRRRRIAGGPAGYTKSLNATTASNAVVERTVVKGFYEIIDETQLS